MTHLDSQNPASEIALDHLVLAADSLRAGNKYIRERFGVLPDQGGQHLGWGTHNSLLQIGGGSYLEIIAPDPAQPQPDKPRPFGLDLPAMQDRISIRPRLVHYLLRTSDIPATSALLGFDHGKTSAMSRGDMHWKITQRPMIGHPDDLLLPTLIDWEDQTPPGQGLKSHGATMIALHLRGPADYCQRLAPLQHDRRIRISEHPSAMLAAEFQTPQGWAILD
ncbi:MAG: VOC family protein [Burkholderiaceae bacterium]